MVTASGHHDYHRHDILKDVATPQLYRANAFRVLGLSITVDGAEMNRQQKKLKMLEKLGDAATQNHSGALPLTPPPDAEELRKAGQRLHDMQARIVDELFWFWPSDHRNGNADAAYKAAGEGRLRDADQMWCQQKEQPATEAVGVHNLAVLHHALALDIEHAANNGNAGDAPADPKVQALRDKYWAVALEHWAAFAGNESGWSYILSRAEALDDPRLTSGFVRRLRHSLPEAILSININLAVRAAKRGDVDAAKRHLLYIRNSGFDLDLADSLLEREASPLVEQVRRICEPVSDRSKASAETANQLAKSVLDDCQVLLTGIRTLLGKEHHLRQTAFDLVASTVRGCMIDYVKATEDWSGGVPLLEQAAGLALDERLQARLREDVDWLLEREASPLVEQVRRICEPVSDRSKASAETANQLAKSVLDDCQVLLTGIRTLLGKEHHLRQSAFDLVASTVHGCMIDYVNATEDWSGGVPLLKQAATLALDSALQSRLQDDLNQVEERNRKGKEIELRAFRHSVSDCSIHGSRISLRAPGVSVNKAVEAANERSRVLVNKAVEASKTGRPDDGRRMLNEALALCEDPNLRQAISGLITRIGKARPEAARQRNAGGLTELFRNVIGIGVLIGVIALIGWLANSCDSKPSRSYSPPRSSTPSPTYTPPRQSTPSRSYTGLSSRIDAGKARAGALESEFSQMDSQLESLSSSLGRYKREIEGYERQTRSGLRVNQYSYEQALGNHNRLVEQHNALLVRRNATYSQYKQEIDSINDMVNRYNRGER